MYGCLCFEFWSQTRDSNPTPWHGREASSGGCSHTSGQTAGSTLVCLPAGGCQSIPGVCHSIALPINSRAVEISQDAPHPKMPKSICNQATRQEHRCTLYSRVISFWATVYMPACCLHRKGFSREAARVPRFFRVVQAVRQGPAGLRCGVCWVGCVRWSMCAAGSTIQPCDGCRAGLRFERFQILTPPHQFPSFPNQQSQTLALTLQAVEVSNPSGYGGFGDAWCWR